MEVSNKQTVKQTVQRDGFRHKWGFILACIGSAVGMGNIWRFPILVTKYGGMTFLVPYLIFVALVGSTGIIGEFALGRAAQAGPGWRRRTCPGRKTCWPGPRRRSRGTAGSGPA